MAQKRMLNKSISLSKQVNALSLKHKLLFTWTIPHLDDYGLIENDPEVIKATVCPMVKEVTIKDIIEFKVEAERLGLTREYEDCLQYLGFENHQSISAEKRAVCKFQKIPKIPNIPQENSGENNNPQKSPVQVKLREDKRIEEKGREDATADTPSTKAEKFFGMVVGAGDGLRDYLARLSSQSGANIQALEYELKKFTNYWTELNKSGTKQRWQLERTFEVERRLGTWFRNIKQFQGVKVESPKYQVGKV
jgi:hypothetical protein